MDQLQQRVYVFVLSFKDLYFDCVAHNLSCKFEKLFSPTNISFLTRIILFIIAHPWANP